MSLAVCCLDERSTSSVAVVVATGSMVSESHNYNGTPGSTIKRSLQGPRTMRGTLGATFGLWQCAQRRSEARAPRSRSDGRPSRHRKPQAYCRPDQAHPGDGTPRRGHELFAYPLGNDETVARHARISSREHSRSACLYWTGYPRVRVLRDAPRSAEAAASNCGPRPHAAPRSADETKPRGLAQRCTKPTMSLTAFMVSAAMTCARAAPSPSTVSMWTGSARRRFISALMGPSLATASSAKAALKVENWAPSSSLRTSALLRSASAA